MADVRDSRAGCAPRRNGYRSERFRIETILNCRHPRCGGALNVPEVYVWPHATAYERQFDADPRCAGTGSRPSHPLQTRGRGCPPHSSAPHSRPRNLRLRRPAFHCGDALPRTRAVYFAPTLGTIYNTLSEFARRGLLREIALCDAKVWYDTKTGPHFHFYFEDTDELSDIPDHQLPEIEITPPGGTRVAAIDVIVRLKKA